MLSTEIRERIVAGYKRVKSAKIIAKSYGITEREVYRLVKLKKDTGSVETQVHKSGRKSKINDTELENIKKVIDEQPDITLNEIIEKLGLNCSESTMSRIVRKKLGYSRKRKVIYASEQKRPRCGKKERRMERICGNSGRRQIGFY